jgi:protein TonB
LLDSNDYPIDSIRKGEESVVAVRMLVDASGRISDCTPITSASSPAFGKVVCSKFMRAKADPAELEDGTKVPSYIVQEVQFRLP